jgi:DNA helicase-2/ATP-dependent DNA helicase PcrA
MKEKMQPHFFLHFFHLYLSMQDQYHSRSYYNEAFLEELRRLNPAQREAVEQIDGPVLVIAGPGTGKTHMLAARIGKILLDTDTRAYNVLCLTFTDAGVRAMRQRLLQLIGPEAYRVHIYTFHSFCNTIIRDNLELFGRRDLEPLSELERIDLIRSIIDELPYDHPLKRGRSDIYFFEHHLFQLFKQMKTERWTVESVEGKIDEYLQELPSRKEFIYQVSRGDFKKGDIKEARLKDVQRRMERLRAACRLYPLYQEKMEQAQRYDYDDMILWVLDAFEKNESLLRSYQERYLYFLVDEYQDTNGAQNQIIHKLIEYWEHPNIFIVGDDDQSIFEFQGARLKNLVDFYDAFEEQIELVLLKNNYRSSQLILDASTALIRHNEKRIVNNLKGLTIEKLLEAHHPDFGSQTLRPLIQVYANRQQEMVGIVQQLEELQQQEVPLDEVAVIFAKHRQAEELLLLLEKKQIPYSVKRELNILQLPIILNLRMLLAYLWKESRQAFSGEDLLYKILHFSYLNIDSVDLAEISLALAGIGRAERPQWRRLIGQKNMLDDFRVVGQEPILHFAQFIRDSLQQIYTLSLPAFVERVINRSGLLRHYLQEPDRAGQIEVLKTFMDFVRTESMKDGLLELGALLDMLDKMDANRLSIPLQRNQVQEEGVQLLTAHSAKGLEFRTVFMIDCVKDHWEPSSRGSNFRFQLPDTLTYSGEEDAMEARRRLFYVSMTRAQEQLTLSYSLQNDNGKDLDHALFIDELQSQRVVEVVEKTVAQKDLVDAMALQLQEQEPPVVSVFEKEAVARLLDGFVLSISSMNRYLKCPLSFFYEYVLRVPSQVSEAALYGTAMHNSLQRLFEQMLSSGQKWFPEADVLVRLFEREMMRLQGGFSSKGYERKLQLGKNQLKRYYRKNISSWPRKTRAEYAIRNVEIEGVPLTGIVDRLDWVEDQQVRIVDYKTGTPSEKKVKPPTPSRPYGGTYWRQLYFYQLLYQQSDISQHPARQGVISFLDPDKDGELVEYTIEFEAEHTNFIRQLIFETYQKIMDQQFFEGCNEPNCIWCQFLKKNREMDSFSEREIEELDD